MYWEPVRAGIVGKYYGGRVGSFPYSVISFGEEILGWRGKGAVTRADRSRIESGKRAGAETKTEQSATAYKLLAYGLEGSY